MSDTIASALSKDPRVEKAKKLLLEAVQEHQQAFVGVQPPDPALQARYGFLVDAFAECRGNKLWFPYIGSGMGRGALVELLDGSVKYDMISGIGVHYFGHSHLGIIDASLDAAISDTVMQGHLQQTLGSLELSQLLIRASGLDHCFLSSSGVMANENALKIAFQKKFPAQRLIAMEHCFLGRTLAASQITDKPGFREGLPANLAVDYIPFFDPSYPEESIKASAKALIKLIERYPKQHAALVFEPVQGEGGFNVGSKEFFQVIAEIAQGAGMAIIADEVQTFGRTPELFAYHYFDLKPFVDIVTIGKLSQVCATLFKKEFVPKAGLLSQTFTASTTAIHAGRMIIQNLIDQGFYGPDGKIVQLHDHFAMRLEGIRARHPDWIQGPWGIGAMIAFTVYDGSKELTEAFVKELFNQGVVGFVAGTNPTRVRFLIPAGVITFKEIDTVAQIVEHTLDRMAP